MFHGGVMKRFYSFSVVSYADLSELSVLLTSCRHYVYILHDKDVNEDGSTRSPHFHILCTFVQNKSFNSVASLVDSSQNTFVQQLQDVGGAFAYLTHQNNPEKFQYNSDELVSDDLDYWIDRIPEYEEKKNKNDEFVDDLLSDDFDVVAMARKYGRDFIKNISKYENFRFRVLKDMGKEFNNEKIRALVSDYKLKSDSVALNSVFDNNEIVSAYKRGYARASDNAIDLFELLNLL